MQCDVLVVGGGSAGMAAAVSAARAGAKTLLVEHGGSLGGMATAALVHSICGLYRITSKPEPVWANPGFPKEFATKVIETGAGHGPVRMGRVDVLLTDPCAFSLLADTLVSAVPNLKLQFHSTIAQSDSGLTRLEVHSRGRSEIICPQAVVDATGDGTVAALAGAAFEQTSSEKLQRPAYIFGLQGIAQDSLSDEARIKISRHITAAVQRGNLIQNALGASIRSTGRRGEAYVSIDLPGLPDYDPLDAACLTRLEVAGRATAAALARFFRKNIEGFGESFISILPSRVGVRESRRIVGRYRLEAADLETGATFSDAVALATWPMELRETATGPRLSYPAENRPCEIPLRALQARDHANLFMAGRCISASHEAQASIRVIGTCLATGEAAGIAAAKLVQ